MPTITPQAKVLENLVQRAHRLYTLPAVAMKVLELTKSPRVDIRSLKDCIENDPALTTKILRVVSSSLFGRTHKVSDLNEALSILGAKPLKLLVLGFSLPKELLMNVEADVLNYYWGHTLVKAVAAREISEQLFLQSGDEAFIAGLLQDLGLLVLVQGLGGPYCQFLDRVIVGKGDLTSLELETLGFDHRVLSARLLESWTLPDNIVRAVGTETDVESILALPDPPQTLAKILHLAERLTVVVRQERVGSDPGLLELGELYCGLTSTQLETLVVTLEEKVKQLADILSVPLHGSTNFVRVLAEAHEQLADLTTSTSVEFLQIALPKANTEDPPANDNSLLNDRNSAVRVSPRKGLMATWLGLGGTPASAANKSEIMKSVRDLPSVDSTPDIGFIARTEAAVAECRTQRCPLSLLVVELDGFERLWTSHGPIDAEKIVEKLNQELITIAEDVSSVQRINEARFAILLKNHDRSHSVEFARSCVSHVRDWSKSIAKRVGVPLSLSGGVATLALPPKNFPAHELIAAAERCLSGVQLSGGDSVRSIDM